VPRLGDAEVRDLPFDPHIREGTFQKVLDLNGELRNGDDVRFHETNTKLQAPKYK
jgi:hypothetical protein